jgi:CheY-like chemotaxis protein
MKITNFIVTIFTFFGKRRYAMRSNIPEKRFKVLLVDDDVDFVEVNRSALENAGFDVAAAYDGDEGMKEALQHHPDLIVLDVMMRTPDEGFELARRLRKEPRVEKTPLLMLTAINEINRARGMFSLSDLDRDETWLPIDRFLEKPIAAESLVSIAREMISKR